MRSTPEHVCVKEEEWEFVSRDVMTEKSMLKQNCVITFDADGRTEIEVHCHCECP